MTEREARLMQIEYEHGYEIVDLVEHYENRERWAMEYVALMNERD